MNLKDDRAVTKSKLKLTEQMEMCETELGMRTFFVL